MRAERVKLSKHAPAAKAMGYMLRRRELFARFLGDGRGVRAAAMYTPVGTAKLNDVDPQAWPADVLGRIAETPQTRLHELLPWNRAPEGTLAQAAWARSQAGRSAPIQPMPKIRLNTPAAFGGCLPIVCQFAKSPIREKKKPSKTSMLSRAFGGCGARNQCCLHLDEVWL